MLTVVFWVAAAIFVVMIALYASTQSMGAWLSWTMGISLLVVTVTSGAIAWVEFRSNPEEDAERGEWTNKMLFYALVFALTFFVAFLYWASLFFAR
jgi:ABC-type nickel/cobalt efflux system permease component RcnA